MVITEPAETGDANTGSAHERETLESITKARNLAAQASGGVADQANAENQLSQALSNFYVVVENYPDLKANTNFLQVQEELTSTENKIGFARQFYNDETMKFNTKIEIFPSNVVAGMFIDLAGLWPRMGTAIFDGQPDLELGSVILDSYADQFLNVLKRQFICRLGE